VTVAGHGVTSKSMSVEGVRRTVRAQRMTTPPMTNVRPATMRSKSMKATAVPTTSTVTTASTPFCDCRDVRDHAKRANRNARR